MFFCEIVMTTKSETGSKRSVIIIIMMTITWRECSLCSIMSSREDDEAELICCNDVSNDPHYEGSCGYSNDFLGC